MVTIHFWEKMTDADGLKNSVMTFYRIRERNLKKMIVKNSIKLLYLFIGCDKSLSNLPHILFENLFS